MGHVLGPGNALGSMLPLGLRTAASAVGVPRTASVSLLFRSCALRGDHRRRCLSPPNWVVRLRRAVLRLSANGASEATARSARARGWAAATKAPGMGISLTRRFPAARFLTIAAAPECF